MDSLEQQSLTNLPGVGPKLAEKLNRMGIGTVQDLLFHLPSRYQDRTKITPIGAVRAGTECMIVGCVELSSVAFGRRRSLLTRISDGTGTLTMRLFYFNNQQQKGLAKGRWVRCYGEARMGPNTIEMIHPEYSVFAEEPKVAAQDSLTPVYPTTEGITQRLLRNVIEKVLAKSANNVRNYLPDKLNQQFKNLSLVSALHTVHKPQPQELELLQQGRHPAQQRLAFEELLGHHLSLRQMRQRRNQFKAPSLQTDGKSWKRLKASLPFELTNAQKRVVQELDKDLVKTTPAVRLIQGDVGSGKTVVAASAMLRAVNAGWQVAFMAPTELLAEQHYQILSGWLEPLHIKIAWLTGKLTAAARRQTIEDIANGVPVAVGTHALFQQDVEFAHLGLIIVDEQHRFGVDQRLALRQKGMDENVVPHQITMTATPIPRSLAMVFYADLDVSSIDELPPGRQPVETVVVSNTRRDEVQSRVEQACRQGRQAYWVCPVIEESEVLQVQAATETETILRETFPELRIALIHGRMKPIEKDAVMRAFRNHEIDLLVATTVIEVGVDVPNASLMVIENAERLGLAQLHQLRGRVGRGSQQSACVLMYQAPLSRFAKERLAVMRRTKDGFEIAQCDLEQRGPGEVLGTRQTGEQRLYIADLIRDRALLPKIERAASMLIKECPENVDPLIQRWVRARAEYAHV